MKYHALAMLGGIIALTLPVRSANAHHEWSISEEYRWRQGQPAVEMVAASDNTACFLTRLTGKFAGSGESVRIYQSGGYWYLGGTSQQVDVGASARCITSPYYLTVSEEHVWSQYQQSSFGPLVLNQTSSASVWGPGVCFLTGIKGKFMGAGENISIGSWPQKLTVLSQQVSVEGRVRCIETGYQIVTLQKHWSQYSPGNLKPVALSPTHNRALGCFLSGVTGRFYGGGEWVEVREYGSMWELIGSSMQIDVAAEAGCIYAATYVVDNNPPEPCFTITQDSPVAPSQVTLDARCSVDWPNHADDASSPQRHIVRYDWQIGSTRVPASGAVVSYTFHEGGYIPIRLRVEDDQGGWTARMKYIYVEQPPPPPAECTDPFELCEW